MSGLTRVNQRLGPGSGHASAPSPGTPQPGSAPVLYPPSGGQSASARASPGPRPGSSASTYSESPFGGGMSSAGASFPRGHELEQHNDDLLKGLLGKVDTLKNLTIGIGKEVREGNAELAGMNDTFGSTGNILSGTFKRMTKMARRQGSNWCWFMGFLLLVFWIIIMLWFFRR